MPRTNLARETLDERLAVWRSAAKTSPQPPRGWIRAIREALGMSVTDFARRMGVSRQRASQIELAEVDGSITLGTLRRAAEALDCTLVYAVVPNESLDQLVHERAKSLAERDVGRVHQTMLLEDQGSPEDEKRLVSELAEDLQDSRRLWRD